MLRPRRVLTAVALLLLSTLARPGSPQPVDADAEARARAQRERSTMPAESGMASAPASSAAATGPTTSVGAESAREPLAKLVAEVRRMGGRIGAVAVDVATGATIASIDEHGSYNPASNAKLLTAAAALRLLGPSYRYLTGLYGSRSGDTVAELVLRGSGDPSLETRDLWEMARALRDAGIHKVGTIVADQSYFDDQYVPPAFDQQPEEWAAFRAPVAALSLNENAVRFTVHAAKPGEAASIIVDPPGVVALNGRLRTANPGTPEKIGLRLEPHGARLVAHVSGQVPEGGRVVNIAKRVEDPRLVAAYTLKELLRELGVEVSGAVRLGGERQKQLLVAHRSAPLGELLSSLGKDSNNFYAESIFKTIAAEKRGRPGTAAVAAELTAEVLEQLGVPRDGLVVKNGSGLFDANRASPRCIAELLRTALLEPRLGADFTAQLAIAGVDGTLRGRLRGWARERAIRAKTGTLASVIALSGYILPPPGRATIAFAIFANDVSGKIEPTRRAIDTFVDALAGALWQGAR